MSAELPCVGHGGERVSAGANEQVCWGVGGSGASCCRERDLEQRRVEGCPSVARLFASLQRGHLVTSYTTFLIGSLGF